ncbi:MAG: desulfoferrodoxin family protein [Saccharofermentanales bacterium]
MDNTLFYRCESCGSIYAKVNAGGGGVDCCGQPMKAIFANSTDASLEKHVPVAVKNNGKLEVTVGSIPHPMIQEHYIQWIALAAENKLEIIYLKPGDAPKATFLYSMPVEEVKVINFSEDESVVPNCEGGPCNFTYNELVADTVTIYEYCNIHGLWKTSI